MSNKPAAAQDFSKAPRFPFKKRFYQNALAIQTASNLSGVAREFAEAALKAWDEAHIIGKGTTYVNTHPTLSLYLHQMAHINKASIDLLGNRWHEYAAICVFRASWWEQERGAHINHVMALFHDDDKCECAVGKEAPCQHCTENEMKAINWVDAWAKARKEGQDDV